jgi:hypothetical protein
VTINAYRLGSLVTLTGRFYSDAAKTIPADPTTVVLTIRDPAGAITTPAVTNAGVGIRTYAWTPVLRGMHDVRWVGTGAIVSADQEAVFVLEDFTLGPDLTTVAYVKSALSITVDTDDARLQDMITAASAAIRSRYQREFYPVGTLTRRFAVEDRLVSLDPYDLTSATTLTLYPEGTSPLTLTRYTDYDLLPVGATTLNTYTEIELSAFLVVTGQSRFRFGYSNLDVAGSWGAAQIPADVQRACALTVGSWRDRAVNQYAIQGVETGRAMVPDQFTTYGIPSSAHFLLHQYERMAYV